MPGESGNYSLQLFDLCGREMESLSGLSGFNTVLLGNLAPAVYVLRITDSSGKTFNTKIVKQ